MKNTQHLKIIALLKANKGWVSLPQILSLGVAQYNARIYELRQEGYDIQNKVQTVDGVKHSWFKLIAEPPRTEQEQMIADNNLAAETQINLKAVEKGQLEFAAIGR